MTEFFKSFSTYCKEAEFSSIWFWAFPLVTLFLIWLMTTVGLKIFTTRKKLKTVFVINRTWIISSLIAAGILIGLICFWWSCNFFAQHPYQLALLISLIIAMLIPIFCLFNLRSYYTPEGIKEIIDQPKTAHQLNSVIVLTKKAFTTNKFYFFIPLFGFLLLFLYFYKGTNLITLVYDNSTSMQETNAIDALSETFSNLESNNEIVLTTLEGYLETDQAIAKTSLKDIMVVSKYSNLKGGNVVAFENPTDARSGLTQISNKCNGSPICEALWKTYLFVQETKPNHTFDKKLLIVITDGADNIDATLASGKFLFDDENFSEFYPSENTFVIDYSNGISTSFLQRCTSAGCDIYPAENNKQAYIEALDNALQTFKNNWYLIYWTIIIVAVFTIIGLIIQPKKIV
ncbi:MAG: hypothetical protein M0D53_01075 [Flavobacterium sp. JAD_PAG50586_2]|nr:MAG: hypothetical protein M0D53_01075 [Flavobacterium sp. JAD_PAG50586_2]